MNLNEEKYQLCQWFLRKFYYIFIFASFGCTEMLLRFNISIVLVCRADLSKDRGQTIKDCFRNLGLSWWSKVFNINNNYIIHLLLMKSQQYCFQANKLIRLNLSHLLSGHERKNIANHLAMCATRQVKLHDHLLYSHAPCFI